MAIKYRTADDFRADKPPFLAVWGKNDPFFLPQGAEAFKGDIPNAVVRSSTPGISPRRRTPRRLRRPSATSFPADFATGAYIRR